MSLVIKNQNGNVVNVSKAHGVYFESMSEAIAYLLDTFDMDGIIQISLKR